MSETSSLVAFVVPAALGAAWSPTILLLTTNILSGPRRPRPRATAFWVGGVAALVIWAAIALSALWALFQRAAAGIESHAATIELVLGVLLLVVGLVALVKWGALLARHQRHREEKSAEDKSPDSLVRMALLGGVMQGRDVSSIILYLAILGRLASAQVPLAEKGLLLLLVMGIVTIAFWLPLLVHLTIPASFSQRVAPIRGWVSRNSREITVVVCWGLGAALVLHVWLQ